MTKISNNGQITLYKLDALKYPLYINIGTQLQPLRYKLGYYDTVFLSIMEPNQPFEHGVIRKKYTYKDLNSNGDIVVRLDAEDTEEIEAGTYYYEIKLQLSNGKISTICPRKKFYLYN